MTIDDLMKAAPPYSRMVEAMLEHERVIVARPTIVRTRILARAREAMRNGENLVFMSRRPVQIGRVLVAAAAGIVLMASVAAAYQMLRRPVVTPLGGSGHPSAHSTPVSSEADLSVPPSPTTVAPTSDERAPTAAPRLWDVNRRTGRPAVEELRLLDRARESDARGDYGSVLVVGGEHERSFPEGRLAEEREVLRVRALVGLGRANEARRVAAKFHRQFPRSVLSQKVDDTLSPSK